MNLKHTQDKNRLVRLPARADARDSKKTLLRLTNNCMHILRWAFSYVLSHREVDQYVLLGDSLVNKGIETRGIDNTIDRLKTIKLYITRYLCGKPILHRLDPSIAVDSYGIPKNIGVLKKLLISKSDNDIRLILSMLSIGRALPGKAKLPDLSAITDGCPTISVAYCDVLAKDIPFIMSKYLGVHPIKSKLEWEDFHLSTKAGPNWLAVAGSVLDALLLTVDSINGLATVGGSKLLNTISINRQFKLNSVISGLSERGFKPTKCKMVLRKLSLITAPERKTRIIAILDYGSQTALKPLHDYIFKVFKTLENDFTFDQTGTVKHFSSGPYYSFDLKSATDRFPIVLQKSIVAYLTSIEYSEAWYNLMVSQEFYVPWEDRSVKYGAGQPMGAYSSGAVFTLTHHFIVCYAKFLAKKPDSKYSILGDDIVINDHDVAKYYRQIISNLGVEISDSKTHESDFMYEFAKRGYRNGVEVSGLQLNSFIASTKGFMLAHEVRLLYNRGNLILDLHQTSDVIFPLLRSLLPNLYHKQLIRMSNKCRLFLMLPQTSDSVDQFNIKVHELIKHTVPSLATDCFLRTRSLEFFKLAMAEIKSRIISAGVGKTYKMTEFFVKSTQTILRSYSGVTTREVILSVPFISLLYNQVSTLRNYLQDLRDPMVSRPQEYAENFELVIIGFNPDRILAKRKSERILAANATIVNQLKAGSTDYERFKVDVLRNKYPDENEERAKARSLFKTSTLGSVMPGFPL